MKKLFLKTLSMFYYDIMVVSAPSDFTEMVILGMRVEEGVCVGRLMKECGSSGSSKKYGNGFSKKKEHDTNAIPQERHMRSSRSNRRH